MVWIYLIAQALILWMIGQHLKDKHEGIYALTLNIACLFSLLLGVVMAPLLIKLLPFLLIAPSRFLPNMNQNAAWTQRSLAQTAKVRLCQFASSIASQFQKGFSHSGVRSQSPEILRSYTAFSLSDDQAFTWSTLRDILFLLGESLAAWFAYLSFEITHSIPETLTKLGNRQVS